MVTREFWQPELGRCEIAGVRVEITRRGARNFRILIEDNELRMCEAQVRPGWFPYVFACRLAGRRAHCAQFQLVGPDWTPR